MFGIRAGKAFDGERVVPGGALVLVDDGRIAGVEPGAAPAPEGCQVLDVPGGTVLPGLVDAHVHLCADGTDGTLERIGEPSADCMMAVIGESLRRHLSAGVTTVRDLGDRRFAVLDWRSSAWSGGAYPAVVAAGPPITSVGGHCANMGGEAAGANQLRAAVRERADRGVDVIKIMTSGGFATTGTHVMRCQFTLDELRVVVEEAHAAGLPVTAHAHGLPAVQMAMAAGVDGIEHCSFLTDKGVSQSEEDLARLAAAGTEVCPTLGQAGPLVPTPNAAALLARLGMTPEQVVEMGKRRVAQMHAAGVRVVAGTDGGIAAAKPHGLLPVSVAFLVDGGVSTVAALASATALAAAACGLGDSTGRLRAGYDADLLVVDGDPVADIGALAHPVAVFAGGRRPAGACVTYQPGRAEPGRRPNLGGAMSAPFILAPGEQHPGAPPLGRPFFRFASGQTDGLLALAEVRLPPLTAGPNLHVHANEDEMFCVLDGVMTVQVGDQLREIAAGGLALGRARRSACLCESGKGPIAHHDHVDSRRG